MVFGTGLVLGGVLEGHVNFESASTKKQIDGKDTRARWLNDLAAPPM